MEILFPDPFLKNKNWAYIWINKVLYSLFLLYAKLGTYIETKLQTTCFYLK